MNRTRPGRSGPFGPSPRHGFLLFAVACCGGVLWEEHGHWGKGAEVGGMGDTALGLRSRGFTHSPRGCLSCGAPGPAACGTGFTARTSLPVLVDGTVRGVRGVFLCAACCGPGLPAARHPPPLLALLGGRCAPPPPAASAVAPPPAVIALHPRLRSRDARL
jgi:hypothetical protein